MKTLLTTLFILLTVNTSYSAEKLFQCRGRMTSPTIMNIGDVTLGLDGSSNSDISYKETPEAQTVFIVRYMPDTSLRVLRDRFLPSQDSISTKPLPATSIESGYITEASKSNPITGKTLEVLIERSVDLTTGVGLVSITHNDLTTGTSVMKLYALSECKEK